MRITIISLLCGLVLLAAPARAGAAELRIDPPEEPPLEDASLILAVAGTLDGDATGVRVLMRARPAAGLPCASLPQADPGEMILHDVVGGTPFRRGGEYTPADPGEHLACAWLVDGVGAVLAGPASAIVAVPAPELWIQLGRSALAMPGRSFAVSVHYFAAARRQLDLVFAPGTSCDTGPDALLNALGTYSGLASLPDVVGSGFFVVSAGAEQWGEHMLCGYFLPPRTSTSVPAHLVVAEPVRVGGPRRSCAGVGGRRGITRVRVGGIGCSRGRSIARRWGAARRPPRAVSGLDCERRPGRHVICEGYAGEVTFDYRR